MKELLEVKNRAEWRAWLAKYASTTKEIWLVYYKKTSGKTRVAYEDAVQEAICFGWIDGKIQKLDEEKFAQRFTPRSSRSHWSAININRANRLIAEKRMTPAGLAVFHPERKLQPHPTKLPPVLESELKTNAVAWTNFQSFPPSYRRMTIAWVASAKKGETQHKRMQQLLEFSRENKRIKFM